MKSSKAKFDYSSFYVRNYGSAVKFAAGFVYDEEHAHDIVGDALLKLLEMEAQLDEERNIRALFVSMVHSRCLDFLRRRKCRSEMEELMLRSADQLSDDELERLCQKELFRAVGTTLRSMPDRERAVFVRIRFNGESYREVAEHTGLSNRSVEYQLKKATDRMRTTLRQLYG